MIEFKKDGICGDETEEGTDGADGAEAKRLVIGLGQAGVNIVDQVVIHGQDRQGLRVLALDSDQTVVEGSVAPDKILLGGSLCRGLGCHGDLERGRALWKLESARILEHLEGVQQVVLAVGLAGATGSILAVEIAKAVRRRSQGGRVVAVCALPFAFEPESRQAQGRRALADLRTHCDAVMTVANDRVEAWPDARENIRHGLHGMNLEMAQAVEAVAQIMVPGGMNPLAFADLRSLFGRFGGSEMPENCWIGRSGIHLEEGADELVARALESPLLGDGAAWQQADSCIACIVGGHDFSLGQLKTVTKVLQARLPRSLPLMIGARTVDRHEGRLKLLLILAATQTPAQDQVEIHLPTPAPEMEPAAQPESLAAIVPLAALVPEPEPAPIKAQVFEPVIDLDSEEVEGVVETEAVSSEPEPVQVAPPVRKAARRNLEPAIPQADPVLSETVFPSRTEGRTKPVSRPKPVKQEELPFDAGSRGRFENSFETIHNGENLDQPTFRRRRLAIKV